MKYSLLLPLAVLIAHADAQTPASSTMPPVIVTGTNTVSEESPVGPYTQPEWTTARRFPTTRVYLQQMPWEVGVEQWVTAQWPRGEANNYLFQEEIELGLPHRFQADLYENWTRDAQGRLNQDSISTEVRYALADWGKIWGNPTLYGEWTFSSRSGASDRYEFKLLLGDDLAPRWHWGANFVYEQEVGNERTTEFQFAAALGYTLIDENLSLGLEGKIENEAGKDNRGPAPIEVDLGPSLQWRPTRNLHIDFVPLVGVTSDSPHVEAYVVVGYDFGNLREKSPAAPVSTRGQ
jgi:hypothetical protein